MRKYIGGLCYMTSMLLVLGMFTHTVLTDEWVEKQRLDLLKAEKECMEKMKIDPYSIKGRFCNRTWDQIACWPDTAAGETAVQQCPDYMHNLETNENAFRVCLPNGEWYKNPKTNVSWTNYTNCLTWYTTMPPVSMDSQPNGVCCRLPSIILVSLYIVFLHIFND